MMTHPDLVKALCKPGEDIRLTLTNGQAHALHMAVGVCGEAGELIDAVKRWAIYQQSVDLENIIEELGDLEFYMEGIRQGLNITREECLAHNVQKLTKRYGEKYSDQAAKERRDKA